MLRVLYPIFLPLLTVATSLYSSSWTSRRRSTLLIMVYCWNVEGDRLRLSTTRIRGCQPYLIGRHQCVRHGGSTSESTAFECDGVPQGSVLRGFDPVPALHLTYRRSSSSVGCRHIYSLTILISAASASLVKLELCRNVSSTVSTTLRYRYAATDCSSAKPTSFGAPLPVGCPSCLLVRSVRRVRRHPIAVSVESRRLLGLRP